MEVNLRCFICTKEDTFPSSSRELNTIVSIYSSQLYVNNEFSHLPQKGNTDKTSITIRPDSHHLSGSHPMNSPLKTWRSVSRTSHYYSFKLH